MSAQKKCHAPDFDTIVVHNASSTEKFIIPRSALPFQIDNKNDDELIPADVFLKKHYEKYGKICVTMRGYRYRDGLTQKELAHTLNMPLTHIAQIEQGKRKVDKKLAQKLAKIFNTDYRLFL